MPSCSRGPQRAGGTRGRGGRGSARGSVLTSGGGPQGSIVVVVITIVVAVVVVIVLVHILVGINWCIVLASVIHQRHLAI